MRSRWLGAAVVVWTLLMICLPLLYLGWHWASDVVAGAVLGVLLMLLLLRLIGATGLPDRVVSFSATHSPRCMPVRRCSRFNLRGCLVMSGRSF
jgi:membrane-associated phospholipid phosphatase